MLNKTLKSHNLVIHSGQFFKLVIDYNRISKEQKNGILNIIILSIKKLF